MIKTGFIGLGNIGKPMADNLVTKGPGKGLDVMVYDVVEAPVLELAEKGALGAKSSLEVAKNCEIIGLCVRDDNDVEALLYGDEGLLENMCENGIIAVHSTVKYTNIMRWTAEAAEKNLHLIDAPISGAGGASSAADGNLVYMVGGDSDVVKRCEPMFETAAIKIVHTGPVGSGIVYKTANNLITYSGFVAAAQAVSLLEAYNLDPGILYNDIAEVNNVITPSTHTFISNRDALAETCSAEDMKTFFGPPADLGLKDLGLALELAKEKNISLETVALVRKLVMPSFLKTKA